MTGNNLFLVIMLLQAAVAYALQPSGVGSPPPESTVSGTTTTNDVMSETTDSIPPVVPPGRGVPGESGNTTYLFSVTAPPTDTALPVQSIPDNVLANRIQNELTNQIPDFTPYGKQINSESGHITIQGSVRTEADSRRITNIIRRYPGVKSVQNNLSVEEPGTTR